jgi:hypothetical protein
MTRIEPDNLGEQLSAYVDGELTDAERADVERLLEDDPSARAELERLREAASWVRDLPRRSAPAGLTDEVMARVEARPTPADQKHEGERIIRWFVGFRPLILAAAMVAISVGIGLWGVSQGGKAGSERRLAVAQRETFESPDLLRQKSRRKGPQEERPTRSPTAALGKPLADDRDEVDVGKGGAYRQGGEAAPAASVKEFADSVGSQIGPGVTSGFANAKSAGRESDGYLRTADRNIAAEPEIMGAISAPVDSETVGGVPTSYAWQVPFIRPESGKAAEHATLKVEVVFRERSDLEACDLRIRKFDFANVRTTPAQVRGDANELVRRHVVSVPRSQLRKMFADLESGDPNSREISVAIADLVRAEGWDQTRQLLAMVTPAPKVVWEESRNRSIYRQVLRPAAAPPADAKADTAAGETRRDAESSVPRGPARGRGTEPSVIEGGAKGTAPGRDSPDSKKAEDTTEDYVTIDLRLVSPAARSAGGPARPAPN